MNGLNETGSNESGSNETGLPETGLPETGLPETGLREGERLPDVLVALLAGDDLENRVGLTIELISVGEDGWPHVALLSAGEVLALDPAHIRLALWPDSRTTANLTESGRGVLTLVHDGAAYAVRLETRRLPDLPGPLAAFSGRVSAVRRDQVGYARLLGGITFDLPDPAPVIARWRSTLAALESGV